MFSLSNIWGRVKMCVGESCVTMGSKDVLRHTLEATKRAKEDGRIQENQTEL
jgi:NADH:ubiquinone oxidoreductase subunit E